MIAYVILFTLLIFVVSFVQIHDNFNGPLEVWSSVIIYGYMLYFILTNVVFPGGR